MTEQIKRDIRYLHRQGVSTASLAIKYGIPQHQVQSILRMSR